MTSFLVTTEPKLLPEPGKKYRLITRSDMDGLVCAVILKELDLISEVIFAHPNDVQHRRIAVSPCDIIANLPYAEIAYMCFGHHPSDVACKGGAAQNHIVDDKSPSAARIAFEYFGGRSNPVLKNITDDMLEGVDQADLASFSREDVLHPEKWAMLGFIMDARTGLGRFRDFRISNYHLMLKLIDWIREHSVDEILALPDVRERVDLYMEHKIKCRAQIERCATVHKNLVVADLRPAGRIWAGNRFMIYALFPQCSISMHALWGKNGQNTVFAVGKSILNRASNIHVGKLMLAYGGGGHEKAGTCQIANNEADDTMSELITRLNADA